MCVEVDCKLSLANTSEALRFAYKRVTCTCWSRPLGDVTTGEIVPRLAAVTAATAPPIIYIDYLKHNRGGCFHVSCIACV